MNQTLEEIFDQALKQLKHGSSTKDFLSKWPDQEKNMRQLLEISQSLTSLPKNPLPQPMMQRKYATVPVKWLGLAWMRNLRINAFSTSFILIIFAITAAGYAAQNSVAGETLFGVKKTAEQLQLKFAQSREQKLNLQVEIAKKRLSEAEKVFKNPATVSSKKEQAVLNELVAETKNSLEVVKTAAQNKSLNEPNHPLVSSLEDITKKQEELLTEIKDTNNLGVVAQTALEMAKQTASQVEEIKRYIAIASHEQTLARLQTDPNAVSMTGNISQIGKDKIIVEKTEFLLNPDTEIKDVNDQITPVTDLGVKVKVSIFGLKTASGILAKQILILPSAELTQTQDTTESNKVKINASSTAASATSTSSSSSSMKNTGSPQISPKKAEEMAKPLTDPNTATGGFFVEDPLPQAGF